MEEPLEHLRRARMLLEAASSLSSQSVDVSLILYAAAVEAAVAAILSSSSVRRSKRLCTASTKRLINMAIVELARLKLVEGDEAVWLRRVLQALRCRRNRLLHPSVECIREKCGDVDPLEARRAVERLIALAERLLGARNRQG